MGFIDAFMFHFYEPRLEKTAQLVSFIVQFPSFRNLIFHASRRLLRGRTRFLMDLVGNPKADRFSRGVATALKITQCTSLCSFFNFCNLNIFKI